MAAKNWLADFHYVGGGLLYKKTGVHIPINWQIFQSVSSWFLFFGAIKGRRLARPARRARLKAAFAPDRARPWYLIWMTLHEAGADIVDDPREADIVFHFDDATHSPTPPPPAKPGARLINFACTDISKSAVARAFSETFGYCPVVDPATHVGEAVEKSEINGAHDGRIVLCPTPAQPDRLYQRVIDNRIAGGLVEDLRASMLNGKLVCVFRKRRPLARRFSNTNSECALVRPEEVFSAGEIEAIGRFSRRLHLDWGGLDVLRDARDGRIYIVDANKTDMGPPIALPLKEKLQATQLLAHALRATMAAPCA